jgi:hypothetical protein
LAKGEERKGNEMKCKERAGPQKKKKKKVRSKRDFSLGESSKTLNPKKNPNAAADEASE